MYFGSLIDRSLKAFSLKKKILRLESEGKTSEAASLMKELDNQIKEVNKRGKIVEDLVVKLVDKSEEVSHREISSYQKYERKLVFAIGVAIPALLLIVIVLGYFISGQLFILPITNLKETAQKISDGNLDIKAKIYYDDEIGQLTTQINSMTDKLKELLKLKDEFVFIATHDLKAPVTAISGYLSLIKEENAELPGNIKLSFTALEEANNRLNQLVEDLLLVARSDSGAIQVKTTPIDINVLIDEVLTELKPTVDLKKISVQKVLVEPISVLGDKEKLVEVIENLLTNAIKFNKPEGSIKISSEIKENFLAISIADSGYGIPKREQSKVFQKFFKYRGDQISKVPGTGLGLFVARMLIEKMGGKIGFTSEEGKGTTFTFSLPLAV